MKTKNKLLIGLFLLGVAAIVGQTLYKSYLGDGVVAIFAPADRAVEVTVDDAKPVTIQAGGFRLYTLAQGSHKLRTVVAGKAVERSLKIESGHRQLAIPVIEEQCYVALEVLSSHYEKYFDAKMGALSSALKNGGRQRRDAATRRSQLGTIPRPHRRIIADRDA